MQNKIYSYGCSFSTRQLVPEDKFWVYLTAKYYGAEYEAWGVGGSEYHEAYHKLMWSMKNFKKGDLVIFQFTDHYRIGMNFRGHYMTTASLHFDNPKEANYVVNYANQVLNLNKDISDFSNLYEFANTWSYGQMYYHYWMVWNLLQYLKETVGIEFILLFLDQTWTHVIPEEHYYNIPYFPAKDPQYTPLYQTPDPTKNVSLGYFCWNNEIAIAHDESYKEVEGWHIGDGHPGEAGHAEISKYIVKHINEKWGETNPWYKI